MTSDQVKAWLLDYAWLGPVERDTKIVDCIMSQGDWQYITAVADQYAGAQFETGPAAFDAGMGFALSALYECHDAPHTPTCPYFKDTTPATTEDTSRCEDYPCCGHTDGLPCNWVAPDYASMPHGLCDHENGLCEVEDIEEGE